MKVLWCKGEGVKKVKMLLMRHIGGYGASPGDVLRHNKAQIRMKGNTQESENAAQLNF